MDILSSNKKMHGGGAGVVVHILGEGVRFIGPLAGSGKSIAYLDTANANANSTSKGLLGGTNDSRPVDYSPIGDHETMMAAIIHAGAPDAEIYSYTTSFGDKEKRFTFPANDALAFILKLVQGDARRHIVSMAFTSEGDFSEAHVVRMHDLIRQLVALDVAVVCSAGNDYGERTNKYPSCFPECITIAAIDNEGKHAGFSTSHGEVDFGELGVCVPTIDGTGRSIVCSGTSPAEAEATWKLAAIWSKNLKMTEAQLYETATANAQDLGAAGRDPLTGYGWIASVDVSTLARPPTEDEKEEPVPVSDNRLMYLTTPRMSGADVYALEMRLDALGYDCGMTAMEKSTKVGTFGPKCDTALRAFQRDYAVDTYGKTCPATLAALASAQPAQDTLAGKFIAWLRQQIGSGYTWGAQGDNLTDLIDYRGQKITVSPEEWIRRKENSDANAERAILFYRKLVAARKTPILEYDCSGLIVRWLMDNRLISGDLSSRGLYAICDKIKRADLKPGDLLFRRNDEGTIHHVGVYVGDGNAIEAQGRDDGVVLRGINAGGAKYWTDYGALPFLSK